MALDVVAFVAACLLIYWAVQMYRLDQFWSVVSGFVALLLIFALAGVNFAGYSRDFGLDNAAVVSSAPEPEPVERKPAR